MAAFATERESFQRLCPVDEEGARELVEHGAAARRQPLRRVLIAAASTLLVAGTAAGASTGAGRQLLGLGAAAAAARPGALPLTGLGEQECSSLAKKNDDCYQHVLWAMTVGMNVNASWYPGMTKASPFEDFQAHLSLDPSNKCATPCKVADCETASPGTVCHDNIEWIKQTGLGQHPDWYRDLSQDSSMEDIQAHIHKANKTACPKVPCNVQPFELQTLFCWAVVRAEGYELGLVKEQLARKAGIFACDDFAVVSDKELGLDGVKTVFIAATQVSGYSRDGTSPNAPIFVAAWDAIKADGRYKLYKWIIKADPDTVLVPARLRGKLDPNARPKNPYEPQFQPTSGAGVWVPNCDKMAAWGAGWGGGWPMMYGSLEIISREGIDTYYNNVETCKSNFDWHGSGEDAFMGLCLRKLQLGEIFMRQADNNCGGSGACSDGSFSAYHPKKDVGSWMSCWNEATVPAKLA